jgi:hypothetical protein
MYWTTNQFKDVTHSHILAKGLNLRLGDVFLESAHDVRRPGNRYGVEVKEWDEPS